MESLLSTKHGILINDINPMKSDTSPKIAEIRLKE